MPNRFAFFQSAMLALLGGRDIQHGLMNFFSVLRQYMKIAALTFDSYDAEQRALRVHYTVTADGFFTAGHLVPLSAEEAAYVLSTEGKEGRVYLDSTGMEREVALRHGKSLAAHLPFRERRYMVSILPGENGVVGHLVCLAEGLEDFSEEHARLMETILSACGLAMESMSRMQSFRQEHVSILHEHSRLQRELAVFTQGEMIGGQSGLRPVVDAIRQLADKDTPVLILGETGTGKELVANAIQRYSLRDKAPFIKINCGALPDTLVDSELFGHERGAFTGALTTRYGRFEQADGGTLFLDEVGELPLSAQVRLLRILQDGVLERVGGQRSVQVNVRIIAATNRDLRMMCRKGTFRVDLFHRLNVYPINLPPLRQRREDIPLLVRHLAERAANRLKVPAPIVLMDHLDALMQHTWPGNVRELENLVERGVIQAAGGPLDLGRILKAEAEPAPLAEHAFPPCTSGGEAVTWGQLDSYLDEKFRQWRQSPPPAPGREQTRAAEPDTADMADTAGMAESIRQALRACEGKVYGPGGAAERLGINHNTLRSRMRRLGITVSRTAGKR